MFSVDAMRFMHPGKICICTPDRRDDRNRVVAWQILRVVDNIDEAMIKDELAWFKAQGIRVKILNIPTTLIECGDQDWVLDMVTNLIIEVMASIAEEERVKIHQRQAAGIACAKAKGVHFGRPVIAKPGNFEAIMELVDSGQMKAVEAMRELGVKKTTYYKLRQTYWQVADRA